MEINSRRRKPQDQIVEIPCRGMKVRYQKWEQNIVFIPYNPFKCYLIFSNERIYIGQNELSFYSADNIFKVLEMYDKKNLIYIIS